MSYECIIFDCDGTLVDSEPIGGAVLASLLETYGVRFDPRVLTERYRGARFAAMVKDIQARHGIVLGGDFERTYRERLSTAFFASLQPIEGVEEVLKCLRMKMCVASSGPLEKIRTSLRVSGLSNYFGENLFSSYVVKAWKPDPRLFLHAAAMMGVDPSACAVVEDSIVGAEAAYRADMDCFLFDHTEQYAGREKFGAVTFSRMTELPELLRGAVASP